MRTFRLGKLVRDGIVPQFEAQGGVVHARKLEGKEKIVALIAKIIEEARELNPDQISAKELGDIRDVTIEIARSAGISEEEIATAQTDRNTEVGGFTEGMYVETVTLPADNKWAAYFASQPEKSPEVVDPNINQT